MAELVGYHDAARAAARSLRLPVDELEQLRSEFDIARHRWGREKAAGIVGQLLSAGLTLRAVADYLDVRPLTVAALLHHGTAADLLAADELMRDGQTSWADVARHTGLSIDVIHRHARRAALEPPARRLGNGHWRHPAALQARVLELRRTTDLSYAQIAERVSAEFGRPVGKPTVSGYCRRAGLQAPAGVLDNAPDSGTVEA